MPRPSKYQEHYCDQLLVHMRKGLSFESFAGEVMVSKQTLYTWLNQHPEFKDAKEVGLSASLLFWEKMGIAAACGQLKGFSAAVWIFNVKNRFGWKDRQEIEHTGPEGESFGVHIYLPDNGRKPLSYNTLDAEAS